MILSGSLHSIWLSKFFRNTDKHVQFSTGRMTIRSKLKMNTSGQQFIMCLCDTLWVVVWLKFYRISFLTLIMFLCTALAFCSRFSA